MTPSTTRYKKTEKYNGTSWTEVNDLNTARMEIFVWGREHKQQL